MFCFFNFVRLIRLESNILNSSHFSSQRYIFVAVSEQTFRYFAVCFLGFYNQSIKSYLYSVFHAKHNPQFKIPELSTHATKFYDPCK